MAGHSDDLYQRMLGAIDEQARFAEGLGYYGIGFTEHHFQTEGLELSTNPVPLDLYVGMRTKCIKVGQLAPVLPAHHPIPVAEDVAILDQRPEAGPMWALPGDTRTWVNTLAQAKGVAATNSDKSERDLVNREAFEQAWRTIKMAWTSDTFSYQGRFWKVPPEGATWEKQATGNWG